MKYEAMDEDEVQSSGIMIPIAIAVLAIVLGAAGLYFGFSANQRLNSMDTSILESSKNAAETEKTVAFFDARISELETKISDQARIINRLKAYSTQSEKAVKRIASELNTNREQIVKTAKQLNEIRASGAPVSAVANGSGRRNAEVANVGNETSGISSAERTYVIESGDNFSKIASQFGVSVDAIQAANPDADSRRLRIGQKIIIPSE